MVGGAARGAPKESESEMLRLHCMAGSKRPFLSVSRGVAWSFERECARVGFEVSWVNLPLNEAKIGAGSFMSWRSIFLDLCFCQKTEKM